MIIAMTGRTYIDKTTTQGKTKGIDCQSMTKSEYSFTDNLRRTLFTYVLKSKVWTSVRYKTVHFLGERAFFETQFCQIPRPNERASPLLTPALPLLSSEASNVTHDARACSAKCVFNALDVWRGAFMEAAR
ncbi:hypothetical protein LR48_Vigan09g083800 [Vigna angularis]|uniref:Uncharacterized protein n=1 Tax=Phaseolus angularis TaxID=3914 RepID=A0A0L9VBZ3_PHAAN|nr:hypothetical protein LR48_Vigan09g083800 [Vigna angularis]